MSNQEQSPKFCCQDQQYNILCNKYNITRKMESIILQKKNKQNLGKINTIINQYEQKLDQRVNQVISEMMSYTKKVTDPLQLPLLRDKKTQSQKLVENSVSKRNRNKSSSQHSQLSFLTDTSLEAQVSQLKSTFKQTQSSKIIYETGRQIGNKAIARPKFIKKKPDIVSRQVRLNPLHERNAIKAYELDRGLLSLIQKGKIGKDVNIITAFQKGRPVLQTQKAIFHQGEERFAQLQLQKQQGSQIQKKDRRISKKEMNLKDQSFDESWALTMPKDGQLASKASNIQSKQIIKVVNDKSRQLININLDSQLYIKVVHYKFQTDSSYSQLMTKYIIYKGQIRQIIKQIIKIMKSYSIQVGYIDSSKVLQYISKTKKLQKSQLLNCIVGCNNNKSTCLKNIKGIKQKYLLCLDKVISSFKCVAQRKIFLRYLKKKMIANRIYGWFVGRLFVKKHRGLIVAQRNKIDEEFSEMQKAFRCNFDKIQQERHYQIYLVNQDLRGKQNYTEILNIQLTKIFNIKNLNKYIVYMLPYALDEQTINYYYKIMQLEEIPNYKERVAFLEVDPQGLFKEKLNLSAKLYYNSKTIKKLKKKIRDFPSYFVVSYPSAINIKLANYLQIPILSGSLNVTLNLQKRSSLKNYSLQMLPGITITQFQFPNLTTLSDCISQYCKNNKRTNKYVIKINNRNKSSGIALLTYPFSSLPQMYTNTSPINENMNVDTFYHHLLKEGGIIQKYQEGSSFVSVIIQIGTDAKVNIVGTFQKISSGFINIGYIFPQKKIDHKLLVKLSKEVCSRLVSQGHFGSIQITFMLTEVQDIFLQRVRCYSTHLESALYYYKFLSQGSFDERGDYLAKIIDTFEQDGKEEEIVTHQARSFCYIPYLLHFGLSERQVHSFFQLCRMGGVSFDLQNKYGATFILLGNLKNCMGLITTAKDKRGAIKLMLKSLQFIVKQNSHNMSNQVLIQKEQKMKQRENIINIKERLQQI